MTERQDLDGAMVGLQRAARTIGAWCWAERRCFEVLGGWVQDTPEPALKALFAKHSRHHAWRAARWEEILPRAYVPRPGDLIVPGVGSDAFSLTGSLGPSAVRVLAHYHVLYPALLSAYEASPGRMLPVTDGPALRAIRIILHDAAYDLDEAETAGGQFLGDNVEPAELSALRRAIASAQFDPAPSGELVSIFRPWGT